MPPPPLGSRNDSADGAAAAGKEKAGSGSCPRVAAFGREGAPEAVSWASGPCGCIDSAVLSARDMDMSVPNMDTDEDRGAGGDLCAR